MSMDLFGSVGYYSIALSVSICIQCTTMSGILFKYLNWNLLTPDCNNTWYNCKIDENMPNLVQMLSIKRLYAGLLALCLLHVTAIADNPFSSGGYPVCSSAFTSGEIGLLSVSESLYNCTSSIPGNQIPPSYFNPTGIFAPTNITVGLVLNNLILVDDLTTSFSMDFYLRLSWVDPRLNMPYLFDQLNPAATLEGLDITGYVRNEGNPLNIWIPDVVFHEIVEKNIIAEFFKLYPNGTIFWSRHIAGRFEEPTMDFKKFPNDKQKFTLVLQSYAFDTQFVFLEFQSPPVTLNYDNERNRPYIAENPLWSYDGYNAYIHSDSSSSPFNPNRHYSTAYINLYISRKSLGIVYRLALPITILMLVVGFFCSGQMQRSVWMWHCR